MARWTLAVLLATALTAPAQLPQSPFRPVDPVALSLDGQAYTLHFAYITPRITRVKTPDKGEKVVWYMPYYVVNKTGAPRDFLPQFELVSKDPDGPVISALDEAQPSVIDDLRKIEAPRGKPFFHTSVGIGKNKIPVARPDTYDQSQAVYGMAVWLDVPEKVNPNRFSVYVSDLSDGLAKKEVEDKGGTKVVISRKTLRIDFFRPVGGKENKSNDIRPNDNNGLGAEEWLYRETAVIEKAKVDPKAKPPGDEGK